MYQFLFGLTSSQITFFLNTAERMVYQLLFGLASSQRTFFFDAAERAYVYTNYCVPSKNTVADNNYGVPRNNTVTDNSYGVPRNNAVAYNNYCVPTKTCITVHTSDLVSLIAAHSVYANTNKARTVQMKKGQIFYPGQTGLFP